MTNSNDDQQHQHLRELLEIHTRNARSLEKQIAQFGIEPPLKLINSLDYEQREVHALTRALDTFELGNPNAEPLVVPTNRAPASSQTSRMVLTRDLRTTNQPARRRSRGLRAAVRRISDLSRRWWAAGGVGIMLIAAFLGFALLRPAPNAVLVNEIRATQPGTRSITVHLADSHAAPAQFAVGAGDVVALFIINDTAQPSQVVLVDGALADASSALTAGPTTTEHRALLAVGEQSAFPFVAVSGRSYTFASAPPGSSVATFWGTITTQHSNGK